MLGLSELKQTKVYQEAAQEGEQRGEQKGVRKEKLATIARLLALGSTVEQIAQIVDLPIDKVQQMIRQVEV